MMTKKKGTGLLMVWVDVPADIEKEFSSDGHARAGCRCRPPGRDPPQQRNQPSS